MRMEKTDWGGVARISRGGEDTVCISSLDFQEAEHRGAVYAELLERFDSMAVVENRSAVPIEIASDSNASLAAYLFSFHQYGVGAISERLGVSVATVEQYLSDFRYGRR